MTTAEYAALYAFNDWHPLAVRPNGKPPMLTGWQSATLEETLGAITANAGANIGIVVPNGMMVLDVDTKSNGPTTLADLEAAHGPLPNTLTATTPTGGKHIWLRLPPGAEVGNRVAIAPGLDVRAAGGYVVAPPSAINGIAYSWDNWNPAKDGPPAIANLPDWLLTLAGSRKEARAKTIAGGTFVIPEGQRNGTLFESAAAMRRKGFSQDAILGALTNMNANSCDPPLDDGEVKSIAANVCRYAPDAPLWEIFATPCPLPTGAWPVGGAQAPAKRFKLRSGTDLCNAPPMRWLLRDALPLEGLCALYGPSGSGKSFLILDIGCAVAGGATEWFGRRIAQAPVTYVCLEGEAGMGNRIKAWSLHHKKPVPDTLRFVTQAFDLRSNDVAELAEAVIAANGEGGMVIVDTLNRAAPGADENSSVDMGNLIAAAARLQSLVGGLVLLVHHTGKDESKGLRGHSSLYAALDGAIEVIRMDSRRAWSVAKTKDGETGEAYPFKLEIVSVGIDEEGKPITSCVALPDKLGTAIKTKKITLGSNQTIARDALRQPLSKAARIGMEGTAIGRQCISYDEAVAIVAERMPTDKQHRKTRAQETICGLIAKGILGMEGEWLWANN